jgi:hypothetical protein
MQLARLGLARFEEPKRLGDRHLIDQDLVFTQRCFGDPMPRLNHRGFFGVSRRLDTRGLLEELADRNSIGRVVGALVDHLEHIVGHRAPPPSPARRRSPSRRASAFHGLRTAPDSRDRDPFRIARRIIRFVCSSR